VTCKDCPDFDLCFLCFSCDEHGHHPGHHFEPVGNDATKITPRIVNLCGTGRGVVHQAICDGCDKVSLQRRAKCPTLLTMATEHHWSATQMLEMPRLGLLFDMRS
jgi:next-to-BRCA1 protein 1